MKKLPFILFVSVLYLGACSGGHDHAEGEEHEHTEEADHEHNGTEEHEHESDASLGTKSPRKTSMANIGDNHIHIDFAAPSVRGREIWGELVPYGKVWVTGAHMASTIEFKNDLKIAGENVPAGKYAIYTIPGEETWTFILNERWDQHLADEYDNTEDVLRTEVTPDLLDESVEQLTYSVNPAGENSGTLTIEWEKIRLTLPLESV